MYPLNLSRSNCWIVQMEVVYFWMAVLHGCSCIILLYRSYCFPVLTLGFMLSPAFSADEIAWCLPALSTAGVFFLSSSLCFLLFVFWSVRLKIGFVFLLFWQHFIACFNGSAWDLWTLKSLIVWVWPTRGSALVAITCFRVDLAHRWGFFFCELE